MSWRLICDRCCRKFGGEIKSIGILKNPDLRCASCGVYIRESDGDVKDSGMKWFPVFEDEVPEIRALHVEKADEELHYDFALEEHEEDLGKVQDEICNAGPVHCTSHKCDESDLGAYVIQIYMNHKPHRIFAGSIWRHDRWPSLIEMALALSTWRGPKAPEFLVQWYKEGEE